MKTVSPDYTSRIIKAGALLADARIFCLEWDERLADRENIDRFVTNNLFGKGSRTRTHEILDIFRRRFLLPDGTATALRRFVREVQSSAAVDRVLYYHAATGDDLLRDFSSQFLFGLRQRGQTAVTITETIEFLREAVRRRKTTAPWQGQTLQRVAQGLLSTARDFGILAGAVRKALVEPHLPAEAFLYILWRLRREAAGIALVEHPDWRLFLLQRADLDRLLSEAAQRGFIRYEALGQMVRIDLAVQTLDEVIDAVAR